MYLKWFCIGWFGAFLILFRSFVTGEVRTSAAKVGIPWLVAMIVDTLLLLTSLDCLGQALYYGVVLFDLTFGGGINV